MRKIYAIRDNKVGSFAPPCLFENDASAIRAFGDLVANGNKDTLMSLHPEDFTLWSLGSFDLENGTLVQIPDDFKALANASDFKKEN